MPNALAKAKAKLRGRDVRVIFQLVRLLDTGETLLAMVPVHPIDRLSIQERKFTHGVIVRASLRRDRNPKFWRKAHVLGGWLSQNVEAFAGLGMHEALKRLQVASGIGVELRSIDVPGVGVWHITEAEPLDFDNMDEARFSELWTGWLDWLRLNAWPGLPPESRDYVEALIEKPESVA